MKADPGILQNPNEPALRLDDTGFGGIRIWQAPERFCYGADAVLLAAFATEILGQRKRQPDSICDLGTGNGIVPLILSHKTQASKIYGIEVMEENVELARKSLAENKLEDRLAILHGNVTELTRESALTMEVGGPDRVDVVTTNPPYTESKGGIPSENALKFVARHEVEGKLEDFVRGAAVLLRDKGDLFMVHRPRRMVDIICTCRKYHLEPKDLRLVSGKPGENPNILLVHCVKNGNSQMTVLPQEHVRETDGSYSSWMLKNYDK